MKLEFDSIDEVKAFYAQLKGTRGGKKGDDADDAPSVTNATVNVPAPMAVPTSQPTAFNPAGFAAPAAGAAQPATAFPAPVATGPAPEVLALVQKIGARADAAAASGQPVDAMLTWFRNQCGPDAAQATMDQIKAVFLPRLTMPALSEIAKLMGVA